MSYPLFGDISDCVHLFIRQRGHTEFFQSLKEVPHYVGIQKKYWMKIICKLNNQNPNKNTLINKVINVSDVSDVSDLWKSSDLEIYCLAV